MIVVTLHKRPAYTRRLFAALDRLDGIRDHKVLISLDYARNAQAQSQECGWIAMAWAKNRGQDVSQTVFINDPAWGIDGNKFFIFGKAFQESDFVIHFEDDTIPLGRDTLTYFKWASQELDIDFVGSVTSYHKHDVGYVENPVMYNMAFCSNGFNCWGWGTWRSAWEKVIGDQSAYKKFAGDLYNGRFDFWWLKYQREHGLSQIAPMVSRTQNLVGEVGTPEEGVNSRDPLAMQNQNLCGIWQTNADNQKEWRLV